MKSVADVSTDDLVNSLLQSVTPDTTTNGPNSITKPIESKSTASSSSSSGSLQSPNPSILPDNSALSPVTSAPSSSPAPVTPPTAKDVTPDKVIGSTNTDKDGNGTLLSIGITMGVLFFVIAALFCLRLQRKRPQKKRTSVSPPPLGVASMTVPVHRGFKNEQDLGMPEMSIELSPGELGLSKGFDMSYVSSTRTSGASNQQFDNSNASSTDSSVFNTRGGLSPTTFSNRKMNSYSYHYRESEENGNPNVNPQLATSTMFHLTGLIGNGHASGRGNHANSLRIPASRKLSAPDEYAELATATNAHAEMEMSSHIQSPKQDAGFTQSTTSQDDMDISMGPDDNRSFLAPLLTHAVPAPTRAIPAPTRSKPMAARASEESMGPDSPAKLSTLLRSSDDDPNAMSTASFLSESSISSVSTRDSFATSAHGSAYVSSIPLLQQSSKTDISGYADLSSDRASMGSLNTNANMARPGSLIALNPEKAKGSSSEIAI
ncbi:unnamed protein product [Peronospora farinosa]|uniref:Uncharacterized protein n=1 Tax=Peronospora farinosa TaxID=134698 RepID=A0AAV0UYD1_9STRA|nr:unnamed protein product [Peronospora farinosa]